MEEKEEEELGREVDGRRRGERKREKEKEGERERSGKRVYTETDRRFTERRTSSTPMSIRIHAM